MNRYAHLNEPEDQLDFHGAGPLPRAEIKRRTLAFLADARERGLKRVRIVTGKGLHSAKGPVVRPQVARTLQALERDGRIRAYREENVDRGGQGAFLVTLP